MDHNAVGEMSVDEMVSCLVEETLAMDEKLIQPFVIEIMNALTVGRGNILGRFLRDEYMKRLVKAGVVEKITQKKVE